LQGNCGSSLAGDAQALLLTSKKTLSALPTENPTVRIPTFRRVTATCCLALAMVATASAARAQSAAPTKPLAVIAINSYSGLMEDVDYIGGLVQMPTASQMVDGTIANVTGGKGLVGLDKTKPIGLLVDMSAMFPNFAAYLPLTDQAGLLEVLKPFGITSEDMGNGVMQVTAMGTDVYAKNTGGWTLVGMSPIGFDALPADPSESLTPLTSQYDVALQFNVQSLPEALRQQGAAAMASAQAGLRKLPNESDADFAARQAALKTQLEASQQMMRELDQILVGLSIAGEQKKVMLDVNVLAVPGTPLAEEMASDPNPTTNFAGFAQADAAASLSFAGEVKDANLAQMEQMVAGLRAQLNRSIETEAPGELQAPLKEAMGEFIDAFVATLKAGKMDGGAVLNMAPGSMSLVAGGLITEPAKIESGLKKLVDALAASEGDKLPPIAWGAETHEGVTFHTMEVPVDDEDAKKLLGSSAQVIVGIGPQSAYVAVGHDAAAALKAVIDGSAAEPAKAITPMELTVSMSKVLGTIATVADADDKPALEAAAGSLAGSGGLDHLHMIAQNIASGVQFRFEVEEGVLQAFATMAMMQQHAGAAQ
jgi:hypothetical protein